MEARKLSEKNAAQRNNQLKQIVRIISPKKIEVKKGIFPKPPNTWSVSLSRRRSNEKPKFQQQSNIAFNPDPLNLSSLCKRDGTFTPEILSPVADRSLSYEPAIVSTIDIHDPLNLNDINDVPLKQARKRRKRKRRNTATISDGEEIVDSCVNGSFDEPDISARSEKSKSKEITMKESVIRHPGSDKKSNKSKHKKGLSSTNDGYVHFNEKNKRYRYGNYVDGSESFKNNMVDERLNFLNKKWFEGNHCLDIGCNTGKVTTLIAKYFSPASIVGIDIDKNLIKIAKKNAREFAGEKEKLCKFPLSFHLSYGPLLGPQVANIIKTGLQFPHNLSFFVEDYASTMPELFSAEESKYGIILCLSVTKWVQLNVGDCGLKLFFKKIFHQLKAGGRLVLEPQPYNSYRRKKNMTPEMLKNFNEMKLMPTDFVSFLLSSEVGFARSECLTYSRKGKAGCNRPLYLLIKSDTIDRDEEKR